LILNEIFIIYIYYYNDNSNFERWIRSKYEFKRFVKSDELPDPDTLPNEVIIIIIIIYNKDI